ncbi:hypothetical protein BSFA1_48780 [Burkholderia sp. SFA1]|uniref:hypothetical protein n=1 Tax=Caballeronia TaxID=1827195 RepID=UPI0011783F90|nr:MULTISPECIES: hypothetical protein [Caballeronia]MCE4574365.1 hypothetical protein [Caballeronia sp. CLC5]BBP99749.1 hypothetical protein BSFA1_48780 [Burkholderia sp. SFA1]
MFERLAQRTVGSAGALAYKSGIASDGMTSGVQMLIRCVACNKLIYSDDALEDDTCPACGSTETVHIAMGFIFDQAAGVPEQPVRPPERRDAAESIHRKR